MFGCEKQPSSLASAHNILYLWQCGIRNLCPELQLLEERLMFQDDSSYMFVSVHVQCGCGCTYLCMHVYRKDVTLPTLALTVVTEARAAVQSLSVAGKH